MTNFILSGILTLAFAVGIHRVLRSDGAGVWGARLIGFYGAVLVAAGVFTVDPMYGFPPGTPEGLPDTLSWQAQVHTLTFFFAFLGLIVAQFAFARRFASMQERGFAAYSTATGLVTPALIVLSQTTPSLTGYILFGTSIVAHTWLVLLAVRLLTEHRRAAQPPKEAINA